MSDGVALGFGGIEGSLDLAEPPLEMGRFESEKIQLGFFVIGDRRNRCEAEVVHAASVAEGLGADGGKHRGELVALALEPMELCGCAPMLDERQAKLGVHTERT